MKGKPLWIGGVVVVLLIIVGVTLAIAQTGDIVYYACVNNSSGTIKMITVDEACKDAEMFISWNHTGPAGLPGSDGTNGTDGDDGAAGADGDDGVNGADGLHCWDLNGDGITDPEEDVNSDDAWDALDCQGEQGSDGTNGTDGADGADGTAISSFDNLNGIPCNDGEGELVVTYINGEVELECALIADTQRYIFVSSTKFRGNDGIYAMESVCNSDASSARLPGSYFAWVTGEDHHPNELLIVTDLPYILPGGEQVAANAADLLDGEIDHVINQLADGDDYYWGGFYPFIWTGTNSDGTGGSYAENNCSEWNTTSGTGKVGRADMLNSSWSFHDSEDCSESYLVYCVQE